MIPGHRPDFEHPVHFFLSHTGHATVIEGTCSHSLWYFYGSASFFCPSDLIRHLSTSCERSQLHTPRTRNISVVELPADLYIYLFYVILLS